MCRGRSGGWVLCVVGVLLGISAQAWAPHEHLFDRDYFEVVDLQLVSFAAMGGTEAQSGPVSAAIVLAWHADRGYRALLGDRNHDGVVDEEDTELLAYELALEMNSVWEQPVSDPHLVDVLARYVAERYPGTFIIKIYDDTFEREYEHIFGKPFDPDDYAGIEFALRGNASRLDYIEELQDGEGVIVGLGQEWIWQPQVVERFNTFFVGRSFGTKEYEGEWLIDLVDTREDPWDPGRGQVLDTRIRQGPSGSAHWFVRNAGWEPLEFMLALSPVREPELGEFEPPERCDCESTVHTDHGSFSICVEVDRAGTRDCYTFTIENIDYLCDGCGLCSFYVPNLYGYHTTLVQWGPPGWWINPWGHSWHWEAPVTSCGIMPGQSAQMGFCVPAPTDIDYAHNAAVWGCPEPCDDPVPCLWKFETCAPGIEDVPFQDNGDCTYSITPKSWMAPECGGQRTVQLTTQVGCPWTASSNHSWISVSPPSGAGSANVSVTATSNDTGHTRSGTVTFSGTGWTDTLTVIQRPCPPPCTYSIHPTGYQFGPRGGSVTVSVTTQPECRWRATSPCNWVTVSPSSGSGSGSVTVTVGYFGGSGSRTCTLTIAGQSFVVYQSD